MSESDLDPSTRLAAADFMRMFMRLVRAHQESVTHATLAASALMQAVAERDPALYEAYRKHFEASQASSPVAERNRQILAELDALIARVKD